MPSTSRLPSPCEVGVDDGFDDGHGDAHASTRDWTLSSTSSPKPASPAVTCSSVLPAMRSIVCENAEQHALIRRVHADEHGDAEDDAGRRETVRSTCLRTYGQLRETDEQRITARDVRAVDDPAVAQRDRPLAALARRCSRA